MILFEPTNIYYDKKYKENKIYHYSIKMVLLFLLFIITTMNLKIKEKNQESEIFDQKIINSNHYEKCYLPSENMNIKISHLIITRFLIEFFYENGFPEKLYKEDYIPNAIRVMKKYLFPSLENQSCKNFIWILMVGDKVNMTYIKSFFDFKNSFKKEIINHN